MADPFGQSGFSTGRFATQSLAATFTSQWYNVSQNPRLSVHIHLENTNAVGSLSIQATNDTSAATDLIPVAVPFDDGTGTIVTSFAVSTGVDVDKIFRVDAYEGHYRIVYTRTSGSGTLTAVALDKPA